MDKYYFGNYAIIAKESGYITNIQIESSRKVLRKFKNKSSLEQATKITKENESRKTQKTSLEKKDKNKTYRQYYDASKHKGKSGGQD